MFYMKNETTILPIFNQAEESVWYNFLCIRDNATQHVAKSVMSPKDYELAMADLESSWKRRSFNFAFGAYDDNAMVAFIQGDCVNNVATIRSLYVLPEYMKQKLGSRLLKSAEKAACFGARSLDLVSLVNAQKFYEFHNYTAIAKGSNHYIKSINNQMRARSMVFPVFKATKSITYACKEIAKLYGDTFDASYVNQRHLPMFLYLDAFGEINGFAVEKYDLKTPFIKTYVKPGYLSKYISQNLERAFKEFKALRSKSY